jgi:FkbM family methyltransferase
MGKQRITYLDIGTNHPVLNNNTYASYREGGAGVCIEPNPSLFRLIKKKRPRDISLNIGISPYEDGTADFFVMNAHTLSTFSREEAEALEAGKKYHIEEVIPMKVRSINSVMKEFFHDRKPDLVSIDVEGWNEEIISSFDFSFRRPDCFCIETVEFDENKILPVKLERIFSVMKMNDYVEYASTALNTIFIDRART